MESNKHLLSPGGSITGLGDSPTKIIGLGNEHTSKEIEHVYVTGRDPRNPDMIELEQSAIVTIEKNTDIYICIHNVLQLMNRHGDVKESSLKWKPYNDHKFLMTFETKVLRDKFLKSNGVLYMGETCIRFKAYEAIDDAKRTPLGMKVWVIIKGLPVQHLCYKTAEIVASRFGRLYACDMTKKATSVGSFRIMVDCQDLARIPPNLIFHFEDDGEKLLEIQKEYVCSAQAYQDMNFDEAEMHFEEVMYALLESNKMTPLK